MCVYEVADIQFLLDASGSVGLADFAKVQEFVKTFAEDLDIGPDNVRIGVTTYSSRPENEFWLNEYMDKTSLLEAIDRIQYSAGATYTGEALKFIRENAFTSVIGYWPGLSLSVCLCLSVCLSPSHRPPPPPTSLCPRFLSSTLLLLLAASLVMLLTLAKFTTDFSVKFNTHL